MNSAVELLMICCIYLISMRLVILCSQCGTSFAIGISQCGVGPRGALCSKDRESFTNRKPGELYETSCYCGRLINHDEWILFR